MAKAKKSFPADYPQLVKEWHYDKNQEIGITLDTLAGRRQEKVFWQCTEGHIWKMLIGKRTTRNQGCPYCSGHRATPATSIRTTRPHLLSEWHPTKNGDMTPDDVSTWSDRKVWWICPEGDEYHMSVANRSQGRSCYFCCGRVVREGSSVDITHPELISKEWHPTKNKDLDPSKFSFGSDKVVWWQCSLGHEWKEKIEGRAGRNKNGCPYCSGHRLLKGFNSFADRHPALAKQWYRHNSFLPTEIYAGSYTKVWWQCPENKMHIWQSRIYRRTTRGCPYCSKMTAEGFTSLLHIHGFWERNLKQQRTILTKLRILDLKGAIPVVARALYHDVLGDSERLSIRTNSFSIMFPYELAERLDEPEPLRPVISSSTKKKILARDLGSCQLCHSQDKLQIDHFIPWSKGGEHTPDNFWTLCRPCNYSKAARWPTPEMLKVWLATGRDIPPSGREHFASQQQLNSLVTV